jgi:16S rRNA (guanine527-N7)-methyltransferase
MDTLLQDGIGLLMGFRSLEDVLRDAQRAGTLGRRPIPDVIDHAQSFVAALSVDCRFVVDLGSGAGIPGLVIAVERPDVEVTMVDRRATRMDALTRAVSAMGLAGRVRIVCGDAAQLGTSAGFAHRFDAAVSRGLGPPTTTLRLARPFLRSHGSLVVSEPPTPHPDRWPESALKQYGFGSVEHRGAVVCLTATEN